MGINPQSLLTYTIALEDNLYSIAQQFGLQAETVYWANEQAILSSESVSPPVGTVLDLPSGDGVYHEWAAGEGLEQVADWYGVPVEDILAWPRNRLPPGSSVAEISGALTPGSLLFVPGGKPKIAVVPSWSSLGISRADPGPGKALGRGFCDSRVSGLTGTGSFSWPIQADSMRSYDSQGAALFIAGDEGASVLSADSGVVLFAGALDSEPGLALILDHGSGQQTYYGNLAAVSVSCGESVKQGTVVGSISAGYTRGATLQFQAFGGRLVQPMGVLPELSE